MRDDEDGAVGLDAEIYARMERSEIGVRTEGRLLRPYAFGKYARGEDERARGEHSAEELSSADVLDGVHARSFAAVLIAARMR